MIYVCITVDWEGTDLKEENLQCLADFKRDFGLPLLHYLNPTYFLGDPQRAQAKASFVSSLMDDKDELGLHIHPQKVLVEAAGLNFQNSPSFSRGWAPTTGPLAGQEVMLHTYSERDLYQLIGFSLDVLERYGFRGIHSFRAGGWMAEQNVFEALTRLNFKYESSATSAQFLNGTSWQGENLQRYIEMLWPEINDNSDPYQVSTQYGPLWEVPNNLGAIDYWEAGRDTEKIQRILENAQQKDNHLVVINSHQETAIENWPKLTEFLKKLSQASQKHSEQLRFVTHKTYFESEDFYGHSLESTLEASSKRHPSG